MTKILIIEDETQIRDNLQEILELSDFETCTAENGKIGLELAQSERPDLVLCDVLMPMMDGYEVLTALNRDRRIHSTPFIFLTAKADRSDIRQGMDLGADDYLTKPFTPQEVLDAVRARLLKQESRVEKIRHSLLQDVEQLRKNLMLRSQQLNQDWHRVQEQLASVNGEISQAQRDRRNRFLFLIVTGGFAGLVFWVAWLFGSDRQTNPEIVQPTSIPYLTTEKSCKVEKGIWENGKCWNLNRSDNF
jgi:DNA-binding response OmpR family regulator